MSINEGSDIVLRPGVDNTALVAGLGATANLIDKFVAQANAKMAAAGSLVSGGSAFVGSAQFGALRTELSQTATLTQRLGTHLDTLSGKFASGMGINLAIGGLVGLAGAFTKAITKAREFQTAQLAIAATLQSSYKIIGGRSGQELTGGAGFAAANSMAEKLNADIIKRQARNILTYQEELQAYQSSLAPASRKGLSPQQTLDVSEQAAIVAKSLGLRGEQIANASRLLMGGGVNVARSSIGRALGVTNEEIKGKQGADFEKYIMGKMKGFQAGAPSFAKSVEGILSTLEAQFDVFFAKIGKRFMANISKELDGLGKFLEGPKGAQLEKTMTDLFSGVISGIKSVADSPAIPMLMKFFTFMAEHADKLVIGAAFITLAKVMSSIGGIGKGIVDLFREIGVSSEKAAAEVETLAKATNDLAVAERRVAGSKTGASEVAAAESAFASTLGPKGFTYQRTPLSGFTPAQANALEKSNRGRALFLRTNARKDMLPGLGQMIAGQDQMDTFAGAVNARAGRMGLADRAGDWLGEKGWTGAVKGGLPMMASMGNNALMAYMGTQVAGMLAPKGLTDSAAWGMGTNAIVGGAAMAPAAKAVMASIAQAGGAGNALKLLGTGLTSTVGLGNVASAGVALPIAAAGAAGYGIGTGINNMLWEGDDAAEAKAAGGLDEISGAHGNAAKIMELRTRMNTLRHDATLGGGLTSKVDTNAIIANLQKEIATIQDQETALTETNKSLADAASLEAHAKHLSTVGKAEYGPVAMNMRLRGERGKDLSDVMKSLSSGDITDTEAAAMRKGIETRYQDKVRGQDLSYRKALMSGNAPTLQNKLTGGLIDVESGMMGQKELLGDDYARVLKATKAQFIKDFNMPLKQLEAKMSAIGMGFEPANVLDSVKDAYEATKLKLKEMIDVPKAIKDRILAQAGFKEQADTFMAQFDQANQSFGTTDRQMIFNRTTSAATAKAAGIRGMLAGSANNDLTKSAYDFIAEMEGKRGSMGDAAFKAYAQNSGANMIRQLGTQGATQQRQFQQNNIAVDSAKFQQQMFTHSLTPWDQKLNEVAQMQANLTFAKDQTPMSMSERKDAFLKQLQNQDKTNKMAVDQAEEARKALLAMKTESSARADMTKAMQAVADYLNKGLGKDKTGLLSINNNVVITVDPKVGLTTKEIDAITNTIKDKLCRAVRS